MRSFLQTVLLVMVIFVLAVLAEAITPLKQLTQYFDQHPQPYKAITIGAAILGWILLAGIWGYGLWTRGQPMSDEEALHFMETSATRPAMRRRFKGRTAGREFHVEVTLAAIKQAWRSGEWKSKTEWWSVFLGLLALALVVFGMFGFFFVIGPPLVKLLCGGALLYATARTAWAFWKA